MAESENSLRATQGVCIACERTLPRNNFRQDAAGRYTSWCGTCRDSASKRWGIEPDHVEIVYALYVLEQTWKAEALAFMALRIRNGEEPENAALTLQHRISNHDRIRFTRIPDRIRHFLIESREVWFSRVDMAIPEINESKEVPL